jgi:hypothetical protein
MKDIYHLALKKSLLIPALKKETFFWGAGFGMGGVGGVLSEKCH